MSNCPSITLTVPETPALSFYAASQIPGEYVPLPAAGSLAPASFVSILPEGVVMASSYPPRPAHAFVRTAVPSGSQVYVHTQGILSNLAGLQTGVSYFLSNVPGQVTTEPPASGVVQIVGTAVSANIMVVQIQQPLYLAD